jgi:hypothetical protein
MGAELFSAEGKEGRIDKHEEVNNPFSQFFERVKT